MTTPFTMFDERIVPHGNASCDVAKLTALVGDTADELQVIGSELERLWTRSPPAR